MTQYSKVFGPTDSAADTKTTIGAVAALHPKATCIKELYVAKGNVVDAKECAGFISIGAPGLDGPHHYAYGNGTGATSHGGGSIPAEKIDVSIPILAGALVTVSVTDAEVATAVVVELGFNLGSGRNVYSYVLGGAGVDPAAVTLKTLVDKITGVAVKMGKAGVIKEIRYACGQVVDAKSPSAKLVIKPPILKGPWEYAVGNGASGDTLGSASFADVRDVHIPVDAGHVIVCEVTATDAMVSATLSLQVV